MRSSHLRFQVNTALGELTPPRHGPFAITCRWRGQARGGRIVMAGQVFLRLLPRLLPFFLAHGAVAAQSIGLQLADSARLVTNPSSRVAVPILVDFASAAGANLAALQAGLAWNPARLTLDSIRGVAGTGFSLATNLAAAATGISTFNLFNATGLTTSGALLTAHFTAAAGTGGTRVVLTPTTAGNEAGNSILPLLRVRNLDVCVALSGRWGDANGDDLVNIIDAQQVARYSVGLSVANAAVLVARADVTADGSINIIDAQQIARFSVGLSAAARTGTSLGTVPVATALALTPGSAQTVAPGAALTLTATPRDGSGNDLTGCATVSWSTSNPTVATVSSEGTVLGVAAGTATITATSGSLVQTVAVTVQAQFTLAVGTQPAGGTSNVVLPTQPALQLRHADNTPVTTESRLVTVSIASGSGTLSGTTAVTTVNGVATFGDLAITGVGAHTLRFSATGALDVTSAPFTVSAPTTMRLLVGNSPTQVGTAGTDVVVPLLLDLAGRGTQDLASVQATITWDPTKLTYVGNGPGTWVDQNGDPATVTANVNNVSTGSFTIGGFTNAPTTLSSTLRSLTFRPVASGPLVVNAQVTASGTAAGTAVVVAPRSLGLTSVAAAVASVRLAPTTATLAIGQSQDLVATPLDANGAALAGRSVTFSSSQPSIATVTATGRVTAVAVGTATMTATSEGRTATAAITVSDLVPGLSAAYFVVPPTITTMPAFRGMVPYRTGSVPQLNYQVAGADTNFAGSARADFVGAVFEGFLTVPSAGNWTLHLESDDGGMLYLNDALVVNNDGIHPAVERSGTVTLAAGRHPIRIEMFEADGGAVMVLRAEGPGFAKAVVPTSMLSRRIKPTLTVGTPELILGVGQTGTQTATVFNPDGTVRTGAAVTWGSTAPTVATVTGTGAVTAVGIGTAYVTAAVDGKVVGGYVQVRGAPAQAIGAGFAHACLRDGTGRVSCWGNDAAGQLGDGAAGAGRVTPATITSPVLFSRVATRWDRNCALTAAGTASCWGQGAGATPTAVGGSLSLTSIVVGFGFSCGLTSAGAAHCWGDNGFGQLGDGTTTARATPTAVVGGRNFVQLAAGADHACGVTADGQLLCWGRNVYGAIGDGTTVDRASPTVVAPGRRFATISAGEYFSCAFDQGRNLFCWGDNRFQHLVAGSTSNVLTPVSIPGGNLLESVVGAEHHLCGLTGGGQMHCRGTNADGELGNGSTTSLANLGLVATPAPFTELALGRAHSCGRTATGAVYCWGSNGSGQLGDGTTTRRTVPTLVLPAASGAQVSSIEIPEGPLNLTIGNTSQLSAVLRDSTNAIVSGRTVVWTSSDTSRATVTSAGLVLAKSPGQVRISASEGSIVAGATVEITANAGAYRSVFSGQSYACAVRTDGMAVCWGNGIPGVGLLLTPQVVFPAYRWKKLAGNGTVICGITTAAELVCIGHNRFGNLGISTDFSMSRTAFSPVAGGGAWSDLHVQAYSACGIKAPSGELWCWGGVGTSGLESSPVVQPTALPSRALPGQRGLSNLVGGSSHVCVRSATDFTCLGQVGSGFFEALTLSAPPGIQSVMGIGVGKTCSLTSTGAAFCFGYNENGELSNETQAGQAIAPSSPIHVAPSIRWATLSAGSSSQICGIDTDGRGYCWGSNRKGQVGDGTTTTRANPALLPNRWVQIAPGFGDYGKGNRDHTCGLATTGEVFCWGEGESYQLGTGTALSSVVPVKVKLP